MKPTLRSALSPIAVSAGLLIVLAGPAHAASGLPPGVPEPGLILWGTVVNATNTAQQINISSASWSVSDGTNTAVYSAQSRPAVRTFTSGNQSYYILEVPFDTRRFGTLQLADPAVDGVNSFPLASASPPTYGLTPTINGLPATVRAIDGAPSGGNNVAVAGFNATVRGRVIRADLAITPISETYDQWAARIFGGSGLPQALPSADPDHDGLNNAAEFAAGTNPLDPTSLLRVFEISYTSTQATVGWQSVASKQYVLESASNPRGPWTDVTTVVAANPSTEATVNRSPTGQTYFRVRVVSP